MLQIIKRVLPSVLLAGAIASVAPAASAGTIAFDGISGQLDPGTPIIEGIFTYDVLSGSLYGDGGGNPGSDLEALDGVGGILRVVRNDFAGGWFTFDASDIRFESGAVMPITFEGFLLGVSQGTDVFNTAGDTSWTTVLSLNLLGVPIDELRVSLDGPIGGAEEIDNLVLTETAGGAGVPEPSTFLLVAPVLAAAGLLRRRFAR